MPSYFCIRPSSIADAFFFFGVRSCYLVLCYLIKICLGSNSNHMMNWGSLPFVRKENVGSFPHCIWITCWRKTLEQDSINYLTGDLFKQYIGSQVLKSLNFSNGFVVWLAPTSTDLFPSSPKKHPKIKKVENFNFRTCEK